VCPASFERAWSKLFAERLLAERLYGGRFVVFHVENGVDLGGRHHIEKIIGEV
jgi:hypothetical protein